MGKKIQKECPKCGYRYPVESTEQIMWRLADIMWRLADEKNKNNAMKKTLIKKDSKGKITILELIVEAKGNNKDEFLVKYKELDN